MDEDLTQCMNPHGKAGLKTIAGMNAEHTPQIMVGVDNLPEISPKRILDVGCGGGIFTKIILEKYKDAKAYGIDISELCIDYSKDFNSSFISADRLEVIVGDVMDMPYDDATFDLIVSNASHFFWSDLMKGLREINRVSKMGAVICFTAGIHFVNEPTNEQKKDLEGLTNILTDEELQKCMRKAGFEVEVFCDGKNAAYIGKKFIDIKQ